VVTATGGSNKRVSLIAVRAGQRPRLVHRVHQGRFLAGTRLDLSAFCNLLT
jgi:hypothetical protein